MTKDNFLSVRVDDELLARIKATASVEGVDISVIVREAVAEFITMYEATRKRVDGEGKHRNQS